MTNWKMLLNASIVLLKQKKQLITKNTKLLTTTLLKQLSFIFGERMWLKIFISSSFGLLNQMQYYSA